MKIQITNNQTDIINGYVNVPIVLGKIELENFPRNSVEHIIANNSLNYIKPEDVESFLKSIISSMRYNSSAVIGGTDPYILAKDLLIGNISIKNFNEFVFFHKGLHSLEDIKTYLKSYKDITIDTIQIQGNNYEITFSRPKTTN